MEYCLQIRQADIDYSSVCSVIARNSNGETSEVITLRQHGDQSNNMGMNEKTVPIFIQKLKDLRCCDGDNIRLFCTVDANPAAEVVWEKSGKILNDDDGHIATSFDGKHASLIISRICFEDEGEYNCVAKNGLGQTSTSACIVIDGKYEIRGECVVIRTYSFIIVRLIEIIYSARGER